MNQIRKLIEREMSFRSDFEMYRLYVRQALP